MNPIGNNGHDDILKSCFSYFISEKTGFDIPCKLPSHNENIPI